MSQTKVYIFNPDNDLALASKDVNYMPPAPVRKMEEDLALLPAWFAEPGSVVLAPSAYNQEFLREMQGVLPLPVELITPPELSTTSGLRPVPWGWNPALRNKLLHLGVAKQELPTLLQLEKLRELSHRKEAVKMLPRLQLNDYFCGESWYLTQPHEWKSFVEKHVFCLLKAPLSGSGKGLNWCKGVYTPSIEGWCKNKSASQGGVVAEIVYDRRKDFAFEFYSDGAGEVRFVGYSLFETSDSGAYVGNRLQSDKRTEQELLAFVPLGELLRLRSTLKMELAACYGHCYEGYLGVDMMICHLPKPQTEYCIHPCVEINLRMNMGIVAHTIYNRYIASSASGRYAVTYHPASGEALREHERMTAMYPLEIKNDRIASGYLPLVPVTARSKYRAWVVIGV